MTARLSKIVSVKLDELGEQAKEKLALAAGVSASTIENARTGKADVSAESVYTIALACGSTDEEAMQLVKERITSSRPKRTA